MLTLFEEAQNIDLELAEFRKKRLISDYRIFINLNVEIEVYLITEHSDGLQSYFDGKEEKYWINFKPFTQDEIRNYPALENIFVDDQDSKIHLGLKYRFHSLLDSVEKISNNDNGSVCPVVNFYSYKGGMGRTTTLTSYAIHLALAKGKKVVIIDCDLEAPGYLNFFNLSENRSLLAGDKNGIVEYLLDEQFIKEEKPNL
ncbi:AAA family ATPase [Dolichospermum heterosporum]|uniref:AAA family ATPase n=2 Tax=Aphanizomenonaceae TaxID=1892259 RepID=A0ABY5LQY6_9CYAN|nr:AAA family ATPase [Dolichospermum heterosporum]UUO13326.1 AAA family ATPase [Dolichospermum heterosporum TAC447]